MFSNKFTKIVKRDGTIIGFDKNKIIQAIFRAAVSVGEDSKIGNILIDKIEKELFSKYSGRLPTVENIQDVIESILIKYNYSKIAKAYIIYREKRQEIREEKRLLGFKNDELKLNINAIKVLQSRYLLKNEKGEIIETPVEMFKRVAKVIASVEKNYSLNYKNYEEEFFKIMFELKFLPNSPCLMNAGTEIQQMSGCFVLAVEDSLSKIFDTLKTMALIQKTGGGTGFSFSELRAKGSLINSTKGYSSGPVSFMSIYDKTTEVIKMGSKRRGANIGILRVDHPDILEFISCKDNKDSFSNFNISVAVTDEFMNSVLKGKDYELIDPKTKKVVNKLNARAVFDMIVERAWSSGDPGLIFIDKINKLSNINEEIKSVNPCGEQPLLDNESCVLGSINLTKFVKNKEIDFDELKRVVHLSVRFLDDVIDANYYVTEDIRLKTLDYRRIGLGIMGFADMLIMLGIPYDGGEALKIAKKVMGFINNEARTESCNLGKEKGDFPKFKESKLFCKYKHSRNLAVTTIAPTGSISLITGCSSGIEPLFGISYVREALEGTKLLEVNYLFEELARKEGFYDLELIHKISRSGSLKEIIGVPDRFKKLFVTALDIKPGVHVKMQAAFQKYVENAVSKTVNLSFEATKEDVKKVYLLAYKLGCKGITVFRYGSREKQVLYFEDYNGKMIVGSEFSGGCPFRECGV